MATRAAARRRAQERSALRAKPGRMRVCPAAPEAAHRVAGRAIALGVARDARPERAARLHRVVLERHVGARKHCKRRVKSRSAARGRRRRERDARAPVTPLAKRLLAVAARAAIGRHARLDAVKRQVVVGVRASIAHPTVVAVDALALAVAIVARRRVGLRDRAVIDPKICVVAQAVHPRRRVEPALFEARSKHAVGLREVTARAPSRGPSLRVTARALAHRRQVEPRRERPFAHATMAVLATHPSARVSSMRKPQIRRRNLHASHAHGPRWVEPHVARVAPRGGRRGARRLGAADGVTARAHVFIGQEPVVDPIAARRVAMASLARHAADREVLPMVEPQRNSLGRIDRARRASVVRAALPHARAASKDARARANSARRADEHRHDEPEPRTHRATIDHGCAPITSVACRRARCPTIAFASHSPSTWSHAIGPSFVAAPATSASVGPVRSGREAS